MALNVKTPTGNSGKGSNSPTRGGTFNGLDGYEKRTGGAGGPKERTLEPDRPTGAGLGVKTPSNSNQITGKK